jgi:hypothetical protein
MTFFLFDWSGVRLDTVTRPAARLYKNTAKSGMPNFRRLRPRMIADFQRSVAEAAAPVFFIDGFPRGYPLLAWGILGIRFMYSIAYGRYMSAKYSF